jgi:type II secretory pathway pseudopilin PulG
MSGRLVTLIVGIAVLALGASFAAGRATRDDAAASTEIKRARTVEVSTERSSAPRLVATPAVPRLRLPEPEQPEAAAPDPGTPVDPGTGAPETTTPQTPSTPNDGSGDQGNTQTTPSDPPSSGGGGGGECDFC